MIRRLRDWYRGLDALGRKRLAVMGALALLLIAACVVLNNIDPPWEGAAPVYEKSLEQGKRKYLPRAYYVQVYEWKALVINACLLAALLASAWWWVRWVSGETADRKPARTVGSPATKRQWLLLGLGLVLALVMRVPHLDSPILFDEQDNLRKSIHGYVDVKEDGTREWIGATWSDTFFENRRANSPVLFGILARACIETWRAITGAEKERFNIVALRLPSLIAGMLSILLLWRLLLHMGFPVAAIVAVFLTALHPMAVNYHFQARGYGVMLCFVTLAAHAAYLGIRCPRWKWWIIYGLAQLCALWAYPGSLYFALAMNAVLGLLFLARWWRDRQNGDSQAALVRFILVNIFSAMLFLHAMLPSVVQAQKYLDSKFARSELRPEWTFSIWSVYSTGAHLPPAKTWWEAIPEEERFISEYIRSEYLPNHPELALLAFVITPILLGVGVWRLRRKDGIALLMVAAGLLSPVLAYLHSRLVTGLWIYHWYIIYALPFLAALLAIGATSLRRRLAVWGGALFVLAFASLGDLYLPFPKHETPEHTDIQRTNYRFRIYKDGLMEREYHPPGT